LKIPLIVIFALILIISGCNSSSQSLTFEQGVKKINSIEEKYGANIKTPPQTTDGIDQLVAQLTGFRAVNGLPESLEKLIDFKIKFLEAEKLHAEGWQWDRASTTEFGFGCKGYKRIKESARLRNGSAQIGNTAVILLESFVDGFSNEAKSLNLTQRDVLALKAAYFQIEEKAMKDSKIIESACGGKDNINETIEKVI
jgi:hypothetical protein